MIKRLLAVAATGLFAALAIATPSTAAPATTPVSTTATVVSSAHVETAQPAAAETPLSRWTLERTFPFDGTSTGLHWANLECQHIAGIYLRQGAIGYHCWTNGPQYYVELWIEWP